MAAQAPRRDQGQEWRLAGEIRGSATGPESHSPPDPLEMGERHFPPFGEIEPSEWVKGLKKGSRRPQSLKKIGVVNEIGSLRRGDSHKKFFVPAECDNAGGPCLFPHQPFP